MRIRGFLEESGFNPTERVSALLAIRKIPGITYSEDFQSGTRSFIFTAHLIYELLLLWILGSYQFLVNAVCGLEFGELDRVLVSGAIVVVQMTRLAVPQNA